MLPFDCRYARSCSNCARIPCDQGTQDARCSSSCLVEVAQRQPSCASSSLDPSSLAGAAEEVNRVESCVKLLHSLSSIAEQASSRQKASQFCMENSNSRSASASTPSRLRNMTLDGATPRKAPLSAKKHKPQVVSQLLCSTASLQKSAFQLAHSLR